MRILIHALRLADVAGGKLGGNFFHVYRLVEALRRKPEIELFVLADEASSSRFRELLPAERVIEETGKIGGLLGAEIASYRCCRKLKPDIFHRPIGQLPILPVFGIAIMGVADLNFIDQPCGLLKKIYKRLTYSWSLLRVSKVVCISQFTADRFCDSFPVNRNCLEVVYHGAELSGVERKKMAGLDGVRFWIAFGHRPNKNLEFAVEAFRKYNSAHGGGEILVVLGENAYTRGVIEDAERCGLDVSTIKTFSYVSDAELAWLYSSSEGLLFTTKYEGFGLPAVEAMSLGCPVLASDITVLREVCGEAAILVELGDSEGLAESMKKLSSDLVFRSSLQARGRRHAETFTWSKAADRTLDIYKQLLDRK